MGKDGCVSSKPVEHEGDLYKKESKKRYHFSLGAHLSKSLEGIEVNGRGGITADSFRKFTLVKKATPQRPPPAVEEESSGQGTTED